MFRKGQSFPPAETLGAITKWMSEPLPKLPMTPIHFDPTIFYKQEYSYIIESGTRIAGLWTKGVMYLVNSFLTLDQARLTELNSKAFIVHISQFNFFVI